MLDKIHRAADAYREMYQWKKILLRVKGGEIEGPHFPKLARDINFLVRQGICIVLHTDNEDRHSRGNTTHRKILQSLPNAVSVPPESIISERRASRDDGFDGKPKEILLPDANVVVMGNVGTSRKRSLRLHPDDVAAQLFEQYPHEMDEMILLNTQGGIRDGDGTVISLLTRRKIAKILKGECEISVNGDRDLQGQLESVQRVLPHSGKVVITHIAKLRAEIEKWMGSGTLCVDAQKARMSPLRYSEEPIFEAVYDSYRRQGIFRRRSAREMQELKTHHRVLRVKDSPIGGLSLVPRHEWRELSVMWAGSIGSGIGKILLDSAHEEAGRRKMYALSANPDAIRAFDAHPGFENLGPLSQALATRKPKVPGHLETYDTSKRDPHLFIARTPS